jgi:hypothetical protein
MIGCAFQSARPMLLFLRDRRQRPTEAPASASSPSLFAACASLAQEPEDPERWSGESEGGVSTEV